MTWERYIGVPVVFRVVRQPGRWADWYSYVVLPHVGAD